MKQQNDQVVKWTVPISEVSDTTPVGMLTQVRNNLHIKNKNKENSFPICFLNNFLFVSFRAQS